MIFSRSSNSLRTKEIVVVSPNEKSSLSDILNSAEIDFILVSSVDSIPSHYGCSELLSVIFDLPLNDGIIVTDSDISWIRRHFSTAFICVHLPEAKENPHKRLKLFDAGANMVSHDAASIVHVLRSAVMVQGRHGGNLK